MQVPFHFCKRTQGVPIHDAGPEAGKTLLSTHLWKICTFFVLLDVHRLIHSYCLIVCSLFVINMILLGIKCFVNCKSVFLSALGQSQSDRDYLDGCDCFCYLELFVIIN